MGDQPVFLEATVEFALQRELKKRLFAIVKADCSAGSEVKKEQVRCDRKYIKLVLFCR